MSRTSTNVTQSSAWSACTCSWSEIMSLIAWRFTDTTTVDFSYNGTIWEYTANVLYNKSIIAWASWLELSGDSLTPWNNKYYGTNGSGTKWFYDLPSFNQIVSYANVGAFPWTGLVNTLYIALDTDLLYIWDTTSVAYKQVWPQTQYILTYANTWAFPWTWLVWYIYIALDTDFIYIWDTTWVSYKQIGWQTQYVLTYANLAAFPVTGTIWIIYVTLDTDLAYLWTWSTYAQIGATSSSVLSYPNLASFPVLWATWILYIALDTDTLYIWDTLSSNYVQIGLQTQYVLNYANVWAFPITGETGKIYISLATDELYLWDSTGSTYKSIYTIPVSILSNDTLTWLLKWKKSSNIASAATTNLATATGNFVHITGTTTITSLWTVDSWTQITCVFDGILTLTHNATSLILPSGANITTAVWDTATFISEWSGNWKCTSYVRANWQALVESAVNTAIYDYEHRFWWGKVGWSIIWPSYNSWSNSMLWSDYTVVQINETLSPSYCAWWIPYTWNSASTWQQILRQWNISKIQYEVSVALWWGCTFWIIDINWLTDLNGSTSTNFSRVLMEVTWASAQLTTANGTSRTTTNTWFTPSTSAFQKYTVIFDTVAWNVKVYINGTLLSTVTSNIPTIAWVVYAFWFWTLTNSSQPKMAQPIVRVKYI